MDFTFGIVTDGSVDENINHIINTIEIQNIPNYEIVVVGNSKVSRAKTTIIEFNEAERPKWTSRKKNVIIKNAKYENVVVMHDYNSLTPHWYEGWLKFGNDFHIATNKVESLEGYRWCDWTLYPYLDLPGKNRVQALIPYDIQPPKGFSQLMYIHGGYFVVKKHVMEEFPFSENLIWGQPYDDLWSFVVGQKYEFSCNAHSVTKLLKHKHWNWDYVPENSLKWLFENERYKSPEIIANRIAVIRQYL